jgi:hypothetical protein
MKVHYTHTDIPEISSDFLKEGDVIVKDYQGRPLSEIVEIAVLSMRLARLIGIPTSRANDSHNLPYDPDSHGILFQAQIASTLLGQRIHFLRGWWQFESCIKGFNALGLMAEQVLRILRQLNNAPLDEVVKIKRSFLRSRKVSGSPLKSIFSDAEVDSFAEEELAKIGLFELATHLAFAHRTIVCSTSSNMGISLHDALRYMQKTTLHFGSRSFALLNFDEGQLIIWCPAEDADFMNPEKYSFLRELAAQKPALTSLRTYINRQQRDPGALKDALLCGGYFFPTNPQSKGELQNLLFVALSQLAAEKSVAISQLTRDPQVQETFESLHVESIQGKVYITEGIEGGIAGLMVPYFLMIDEILGGAPPGGLSTWNQASIGAALAAAVLADHVLRNPDELSEQTRSDMNSQFPNISRFMDHRQFGQDLRNSIHGVFDIANLQSLAQLLGVVVEKHVSGRATAYVGLGSSSYSNGNRCYEILKKSIESDGPFKGKKHFHPATHAINPLAQAIIYGEEVYRCWTHPACENLSNSDAQRDFVRSHVRKPEPAGAAALAGYILARLDAGTLSLLEIAYGLRLLGFTKNVFLSFLNFPANELGMNAFLQSCYEEGVYMGDLLKNVLLCIDWPIEDLEQKAMKERIYSQLKYVLAPLDPLSIENSDPLVTIYLTGDNTHQPADDLLAEIIRRQRTHKVLLKDYSEIDSQQRTRSRPVNTTIRVTNRLWSGLSARLKLLEQGVDRLGQRTVNRIVSRQINRLSEGIPRK